MDSQRGRRGSLVGVVIRPLRFGLGCESLAFFLLPPPSLSLLLPRLLLFPRLCGVCLDNGRGGGSHAYATRRWRGASRPEEDFVTLHFAGSAAGGKSLNEGLPGLGVRRGGREGAGKEKGSSFGRREQPSSPPPPPLPNRSLLQIPLHPIPKLPSLTDPLLRLTGPTGRTRRSGS